MPKSRLLLSAPQIVFILLAASAVIKLYHFTMPALDWHSWKQIYTLASARYIYLDGASAFWIPRQDLLQSLDPESNRTFLEFPLIHLLMAMGYWAIGGEAEWVGRLWSILFSLLGGVYLARLARRDLTPSAGVIAVGIFALSPMNVYYQHMPVTDVPFLAFMIVGLFYFVRWLEGGRLPDALRAGCSIGLAALFKPYALYMGATFLYLLARRKGWRGIVTPQTLAIGILSVVPAALWVLWGWFKLPQETGLNPVADGDLLGSWRILARPEYYSRLFAWWGDLSLTPFFTLFAAVGIGVAVRRRLTGRTAEPALKWPDWLTAWWLGILVYVVFVRQGNWTHDYYAMSVLAPLSVTSALGTDWLWKRYRGRGRWVQWTAVAVVSVSIVYSVFVVLVRKSTIEWDSYNAGKAVAAVRKPGELTVFFEAGGLRYHQSLYYTGGKGWLLPAKMGAFSDLKPYTDRGARFFLISMLESDWKEKQYPVEFKDRLLSEGRLRLIAESAQDRDRYGSPRHWAVYRILD